MIEIFDVMYYLYNRQHSDTSMYKGCVCVDCNTNKAGYTMMYLYIYIQHYFFFASLSYAGNMPGDTLEDCLEHWPCPMSSRLG